MAVASVVAIYGVPAGKRRERRLGTGHLALPRLVVVDEALERQLASSIPPAVRRVGIASIAKGAAVVEVIEVVQVMRSSEEFGASAWGLELSSDSTQPTSFPSSTDPATGPLELAQKVHRATRLVAPVGALKPKPPQPAPAGLWCKLFPQLSFCH